MSADEIERIRRRYVTTRIADLAAFALALLEAEIERTRKPIGRPVYDGEGNVIRTEEA